MQRLTKLIMDAKGASSMIIVMFMAIIVSILTLSFVRIGVNELQDASNQDLSTRAYYAAESGVEDARRALIARRNGSFTGNLNKDTCAAPDGYITELSPVGEFDVSYTCMLIDDTPGSLTASLASPNQTKMYDVNPVNPSGATTNISTITLRWHVDAAAGGGEGDGVVDNTSGPVRIRGATDYNLPRVSAWTHPALMRVMFIGYPDTDIERGDIQTVNTYISPTADDLVGPNGQSPRVFNGGGTPNPAVDGQVLGATCTDANDGTMACEMVFDMQAYSQGLTMRITNMYASTSFELSMEATNSDTLLFDGVQTVIDVTGQAGQVSRRVEAVVDLDDPDMLPDFTLQSGLDICKDFSYGPADTDFVGESGTSCTQPGI